MKARLEVRESSMKSLTKGVGLAMKGDGREERKEKKSREGDRGYVYTMHQKI